MGQSAVLLLDCPDRRGIVAAVSDFLYKNDANILHADQHQDSTLALFFMRVEWDLERFAIPEARFAEAFSPIARNFEMNWRVARSDRPLKVALMVSKYDHCLNDL